jgi:hypothetical protein
MNRKMIYVFGLVGFFLMWGVFGFAAAAPRGEADLEATLQPVENTPILPAETEAVGIPVTGETEPVWIEVVGFYGLIGLAAMFLILALLSFANKLTAPAVERKGPPSEETHKN